MKREKINRFLKIAILLSFLLSACGKKEISDISFSDLWSGKYEQDSFVQTYYDNIIIKFNSMTTKDNVGNANIDICVPDLKKILSQTTNGCYDDTTFSDEIESLMQEYVIQEQIIVTVKKNDGKWEYNVDELQQKISEIINQQINDVLLDEITAVKLDIKMKDIESIMEKEVQ